MGIFELLDYACAALAEAGYQDPWSWTPRQIFHRLDVHNRLAATRRMLDLQTGLLAARGDERSLQKFEQAQRRLALPKAGGAPDDREDEPRAAPPQRVRAMDEELRKVGWA